MPDVPTQREKPVFSAKYQTWILKVFFLFYINVLVRRMRCSVQVIAGDDEWSSKYQYSRYQFRHVDGGKRSLCTLWFQRRTQEEKSSDFQSKNTPSFLLGPQPQRATHVAFAWPFIRASLHPTHLVRSSGWKMQWLTPGTINALGAIILLDSNPGDGNDNVHALLLGSLPLVAVCAVLLVVPEGANRAVHAATTVLVGFRGRANVLDDGAVGDVLVGRLRGSFRGGGFG
jgi:hypothetical protein